MKIGITGVSGILGAQIAKTLLSNNHNITGFINSSPCTLPVSFVKIDITDSLQTRELIKNFDLIIHCAAFVSFHKKHAQKMFLVNALGTQNVVNACIANKIPKLIHISSTAVLDDTINPINEKTLWNRTSYKTDYAISKYEAELEAWRAQEEGVQTATVCPGIIIGSGESKKSSDQLYSVIRKNWNVYPCGSNGFINANEVAKIVSLIIEKGAFGKRYLAVTHNTSYKQVLDAIAEKLAMPKPKYKISNTVVRVITPIIHLCEKIGIKMPLPSQGIINSSKNVSYNPQAIFEHLNYTSGSLI